MCRIHFVKYDISIPVIGKAMHHAQFKYNFQNGESKKRVKRPAYAIVFLPAPPH